MTDRPNRPDGSITRRFALIAVGFFAFTVVATASIIDSAPAAQAGPQASAVDGTSHAATSTPPSAATPTSAPRLTAAATRGTATAKNVPEGPAATTPPLPVQRVAVVAGQPVHPSPLYSPIRAAFYYPWYPGNWHQGNPDPWTHYHPSLGLYDSTDPAVVQAHIAAMQYAGMQAGIASWWGQGSREDQRIPSLLQGARATGFMWSLYYEPVLSAAAVRSDLAYIMQNYGGDPNFLHLNGKPVVFVYSRSVTSCADIATWVNNNPGVYLNLAALNYDYSKCTAWPDAFHVYSPNDRLDVAKPHSVTISPGFWQADESTPRLARDLAAFTSACKTMVQSNAQWQLVATFNEFGEGTQVESTTEYATPSGYGAYLDALHNC